jgi:hypothetical protein
MSDLFYPLSLIQSLQTTKLDRSLTDPFEDGASSARRLWPAKTFRRRLELKHSPLTPQEWTCLDAFHTARDGRYDSFWFRDNVNRKGNFKVRFSETLTQPRDAALTRGLGLKLDETAATRDLVSVYEIAEAAGLFPLLWYDANRELYLEHNGQIATDPFVCDSSRSGFYSLPWNTHIEFTGLLTPYQAYSFKGTNQAQGVLPFTSLATGQPACTVFAFVRQTGSYANQVLFSFGSGAAGQLGLQWTVDNCYAPWYGTAGLIAPDHGCYNSEGEEWRSIALAWPASSNNYRLGVNGVCTDLTSSVARSYVQAPPNLGCAAGGAYAANPSHADTENFIGQILVFNVQLTAPQILALHNLLSHQYPNS